MYARFQALMTTGYGLANKLYFKEFDPNEFEAWIQDCQSLLSSCEPEPYFPRVPIPATSRRSFLAPEGVERDF